MSCPRLFAPSSVPLQCCSAREFRTVHGSPDASDRRKSLKEESHALVGEAGEAAALAVQLPISTLESAKG